MLIGSCNIGLDIGSTTAKAVIADSDNNILYKSYRRHLGKIDETLIDILDDIREKFADIQLKAVITGSAGMGLSEKIGIPFIQELIASAEFVSSQHPDITTLIDIGGEDSKIIFFNDLSGNDIRMNGSCAGGTGAFIDQMTSLLNITHDELNTLAFNFNEIYPIASRCGVFAKTDVQNLIAREVPKEDIAASIFYAVAIQIKNSLLRGSDIKPKITFSGGPLTFLPAMKNSLVNVFELNDNEVISIDNSEYIPAIGAALAKDIKPKILSIDRFIDLIINKPYKKESDSTIQPLFKNNLELFNWIENRNEIKAKRCSFVELDGKFCYLGVDSGSTTTKIVLIDEEGRIAFDFYQNNNSNPLSTVKEGLQKLKSIADKQNINLKIAKTVVTGYGEDLIKTAFGFDYGVVETIAHSRSAIMFDENVTFILDIGGQDMKAMFINKGIVRNIEINEACSSGCGSFIETFANSLDYSIDKFAEIACNSQNPCNLGTRCTVFMNSKVKQAFREGASIEDISAGLAYSVIQNCLHKVLKIFDNSVLGANIIVQGGTFRNPAIHKAFENILGKKVICPDISPLMGAYGAALLASDFFKDENSEVPMFYNLNNLELADNYEIKYIHCKGCDNSCSVSKLRFDNGNIFYTGNRCENIYSNTGKNINRGFDLPKYKYDLLFYRKMRPESEPVLKLGIPRVLNYYENFPFWWRLFIECGIELCLSDKSTNEISDSGAGTVMSDNICFPAKIAHGHILNLIEKQVDRIFYPIVTYEKNEFSDSSNCYNCPVVSGYPDVIRSAISPENKHKLPFDTPNITFKDEILLEKTCYAYLKQFGIKRKQFKRAFKLAFKEQIIFKETIRKKGREIIDRNKPVDKPLIVLSGRPYQIDPLINHGIPQMIADFGFDVLTEDSLPIDENIKLDDVNVLTQWGYPNRLYYAAKWTAMNDNAELIQLNNFGCGPDTVAIDEIREISEEYGKTITLIRIDELTSAGSLRLRIRSLIESLKLRKDEPNLLQIKKRELSKSFTDEDSTRTILVPFFSTFHSGYTSAAFTSMGYKFELLPPSDRESIELGLKYVNNEICYPATLIIGDILKALKSGKYDLSKIAVGLSQTGGQCRASNYIPLLKKALVKHGFKDVPVVGVSNSGKLLNNQPGFKINKVKLTLSGAVGLLFGDALSRLFYSVAPREVQKGSALKLVEKYSIKASETFIADKPRLLYNHLAEAVDDFNSIQTINDTIPKIGIVGEVYVKYNSIGNQYLLNDLMDKRVELLVPPLINTFIQWLVNVHYKDELKIEKKTFVKHLSILLEKYYDHTFNKFEQIMKSFKFNIPAYNIQELALKAESFMNMSHHYYGEGWLITADILAFIEEGIYDVVCLQPFGCIANHIVARGMEKRLKDLHPKLNLLYLDIDAGNSEVNLHNRLHLVLRKAKKRISDEV